MVTSGGRGLWLASEGDVGSNYCTYMGTALKKQVQVGNVVSCEGGGRTSRLVCSLWDAEAGH